MGKPEGDFNKTKKSHMRATHFVEETLGKMTTRGLRRLAQALCRLRTWVAHASPFPCHATATPPQHDNSNTTHPRHAQKESCHERRGVKEARADTINQLHRRQLPREYNQCRTDLKKHDQPNRRSFEQFGQHGIEGRRQLHQRLGEVCT